MISHDMTEPLRYRIPDPIERCNGIAYRFFPLEVLYRPWRYIASFLGLDKEYKIRIFFFRGLMLPTSTDRYNGAHISYHVLIS